MDEAAGIDQDELEAEAGAALPDREAMSVISPMPGDDMVVPQDFPLPEPLPPSEEL